MAVAFIFEIPGGTQEQYDSILEKMKQKGILQNPKRSYHVAGPMEGGWRVVDVWESQDALDTFIKTDLGPIMQEVGMPQPKITSWNVHNVIK
ncbi:hypothetical protein HY029_05160 [Candidatus Gottesmanbacteria bacterium]|nr:hypothetical protein [Candidatus Gottesmanbacteria bacterium]